MDHQLRPLQSLSTSLHYRYDPNHSLKVPTEENSSAEQIRWLIDHGRPLLAELRMCSPKEFNLEIFAGERLAAWQQSLLQQQVALRWRSRTRFPRPDRWLWTERSLAQASDYWSARYKASLFPINQTVVDGCCGAGADLVAIAGHGNAIGIDSDPFMMDLSRDNAKVHGYEVEVINKHISATDWQPPGEWLSIDPDRRASGKRTTDADEFSPSLDTVLTIVERLRGALIKLAPSTRVHDDLLKRMEDMGQRVWLGNQGECRQQLLLTGQLAQGSLRMAVLCEPDAQAECPGKDTMTAVDSISNPSPQRAWGLEYLGNHQSSNDYCDLPGSFVVDLHHVLHASELQASWASENNLRCLGSVHGYFTTDIPLDSPWAKTFEVLAVLPWDDRQLRKWLRKRGAGQVEVKTRGLQDRSIKIDANASQKRYSAAEGEPMTLLVTRLAGRIRCIIARRLGNLLD